MNDYIEDILPLLPFQKTILYSTLMHPDKHLYYEQWRYKIYGGYNIRHIEMALVSVCKMHQVLRGVFRWEKLTEPVLVILREKEIKLQVSDLRMYSDTIRQRKADDAAKQLWENKVDIKTEPFRASITVLNENELELIIDSNHILFDGWSNAIIIRDLWNNYLQLSGSSDMKQELHTLKYSNYLDKTLKEMLNRKHVRFWKDYLQPAYVTPKKNQVPELDMRMMEQKIDLNLMELMNRYCTETGISLAVLLYGAWVLMKAEETGEEHIVIGVTISGRQITDLSGIEDLVGLLIRTLPLQVSLSGNIRIKDMLLNIQNDLEQIKNHMFLNYNDTNILFGGLENVFQDILSIQNYPVSDKLLGETGRQHIKFYSSYYEPGADITTSVNIFNKEEIKLQCCYNASVYPAADMGMRLYKLLEIMSVIAGKSLNTVRE